MIRPIVRAAILAWLLATSLAAQQGPAQTSGVSGAIVDESGQPVSTVMIVVFPVDEQKWTTGRDSKTVQWTAADAGAFKITGLPPGEYKLAITQEKIDGDGPDAALLETLVRRGFPLSLAAGQQAQLQIVLNAQMQLSRVGMSGLQRVIAGAGSSGTLPPGPGPGARIGAPPNLPPAPAGPAAISGKVTDADGKPVVGAQIQRLLPVVRNGVTQFAPTGQPTMTDEEGVYHLKGLMPGNFLVAAVARSLDFSAPGAPELTHMPASIVGPDGRKLGYVTTYYPGTDTTARAARVTVGVSEVTGINFSLQRQPMADVSGTLTGAAHHAARGRGRAAAGGTGRRHARDRVATRRGHARRTLSVSGCPVRIVRAQLHEFWRLGSRDHHGQCRDRTTDDHASGAASRQRTRRVSWRHAAAHGRDAQGISHSAGAGRAREWRADRSKSRSSRAASSPSLASPQAATCCNRARRRRGPRWRAGLACATRSTRLSK